MQFILLSIRLRRWYPLQRRQMARPRYRDALTAPFRVLVPLKCPKPFSAILFGVPTAVLVAIISHCVTMLAVAVSSPTRTICRLRLSTIQLEYIAQHGTSGMPVATETLRSAQFPERNSWV